jgi:hypothetical protein
LPSASTVVSRRGDSSSSMRVVPRRPDISTGTISSRKCPASIASIAFWCDWKENSSASWREMPALSAVYSACPPMWHSPKEHQSPSWTSPSISFWSPNFTPFRIPRR